LLLYGATIRLSVPIGVETGHTLAILAGALFGALLGVSLPLVPERPASRGMAIASLLAFALLCQLTHLWLGPASRALASVDARGWLASRILPAAIGFVALGPVAAFATRSTARLVSAGAGLAALGAGLALGLLAAPHACLQIIGLSGSLTAATTCSAAAAALLWSVRTPGAQPARSNADTDSSHRAPSRVAAVGLLLASLGAGVFLQRFEAMQEATAQRAVLAPAAAVLIGCLSLAAITRGARPKHSSQWVRASLLLLVTMALMAAVGRDVTRWDDRRIATGSSQAPVPRPIRRATLGSLALAERPGNALVLGDGTSIADVLDEAGVPSIVLVGEVIDVARTEPTEPPEHGSNIIRVHENERRFVDRCLRQFDLIIIAPPRAPVYRDGFRFTAEFLIGIESRLTRRGTAVWMLESTNTDPLALATLYLAAAAAELDDFSLFIDHPRSNRPVLSLMFGPGQRTIPPERVEGRLAELEDLGDELAAVGLDMRGLVRCFVCDQSTALLYYEGVRNNSDEFPWLALHLRSAPQRPEAAAAQCIARMSVLRVEPTGRLGGLGQDDFGRERAFTFRRDFEATTHIMGMAGVDVKRDPAEDPVPHEAEVPVLFAALRKSPDFPMARIPIEALLARHAAVGDNWATIDVLKRLSALDSRPDDRLALARAYLTEGNVIAATNEVQQLLKRHPEHAAGKLQLGFLLAGMGKRTRANAVPLIERAVASGEIGGTPLHKARVVLAFLAGDGAMATELLDDMAPEDTNDALLRFIRMSAAVQ